MRLKDTHCEIEGQHILDYLNDLRVVKYNYKCDAEDGCCEPQVGMIAQEVNRLYKDLGLKKNYNPAHPYSMEHPEEEPIQTVCGDEIAYLAMAAIKAQNQQIIELQDTAAAQQSELASLKDEVAKLKGTVKDAIAVIKSMDAKIKNLT